MSVEKVLHYSCTCLYCKYFTSCCRSHLNLCKAFVLYHSQYPVRSNSFLKVANSPHFFLLGLMAHSHDILRNYLRPIQHTASEGHSVSVNPCNCFHNCPKTTTGNCNQYKIIFKQRKCVQLA
jgi:hypothetical protein